MKLFPTEIKSCILSLLLPVILASCLSAICCSAEPDPAAKQTVIAVIPADFRPTYVRDPQDGKAYGLAVDVMNELARLAGLRIEYRFAEPWEEIEDMVLSGRADIIPFRVINEKTKSRFLFTDSLDVSPINYVVRASDTTTKGKAPGKKVGVINGSGPYEALKEQHEMTVIPCRNMQNLLMELLTGHIDIAMTTTDNLLKLAEQAGLREKVRVIDPPAYEVTRALALRAGNEALRDRLNQAIQVFQGSTEQREIYGRWLGKPAAWWTAGRVLIASGCSVGLLLLILVVWRFREMQRLNKRLWAERTFLQTLIDAIPESIYYKNREGVFTLCNTFFANAVMGLTREQIIGKNDFDLFSNRVLAEFFREEDRQTIMAAEPQKKDEWISLADGRSVLVETLSIPFQAETGKESGIIGISREITEREQAHQLQVEARNRMQIFLDTMPMMAWIKDTDGRYEMVNEAYLRSCGLAIDEVIGKTDPDLWPQDVAEKYCGEDQEVLRTRRKKLFEDRVATSQADLFFQTFKSPIINERGTVIGTAGVAQDITERKRAEDVLRRFQLLVTHSRDIILFVRLDNMRIMEANTAATKAYGYSREQLLTMTVPQLRGADPLELIHAQMEQANRHGILVETVHYRSDGSGFPVEVSSQGETVDGVRMLISVVRDITDRKRAEEAVRLSEERFRKIFDESPIGIAFLDKQREIFATNKQYRDFLGYSEEEIREKGPAKLLHPDDLAVSVELSEKLRAGEIPLFHMEQRYIRGDGALVWSDTRITVLRDEKGQLVHTIGWVMDITSRKLAEAALRKSEAEYKRLSDEFHIVLEAIPDSLALVSPDFRVVWANRHAIETMRGHDAYYPGEACYTLWYMRSEPCETCYMQSVMDTGEFCEFTQSIEDRMWEFRMIPVKDESGTVINALRLGRDITETRNLESQLRQAQKLEAIGTLAGGIAHDFNNILSPIIGYTEMVMEELPESGDLRSDLEQVLAGAHRARELVKQILAFSRKGQDEPMTGVDISTIVNEVLKLLKASLPSTIEIRHDVEKGVALVDATQIHQVILNLCTNAAHAMEGKGRLDVSLIRTYLDESQWNAFPALSSLEPGRYLKLSVSDTGHGMDEKTLQRIFEPYFTTKETGKGTGLGLAVAHGIVRRHGGEITVQSEPGKGSSFSVYLPLAMVAERSFTDEQDALPQGTERILLVDDEEILADLEVRMLTRLGYSVTAQSSAPDALEFFRSRSGEFDLIFTDFTMPVLNGIELAEEIQKIRPDIPIILCTGFSEKVTEETVAGKGIRKLIMKPLERRRLATVIREVLDA